jgi:hypothetical protein
MDFAPDRFTMCHFKKLSDFGDYQTRNQVNSLHLQIDFSGDFLWFSLFCWEMLDYVS